MVLIAKLAVKIVKYLALFVVEHDIQKVLLRLVYAVVLLQIISVCKTII